MMQFDFDRHFTDSGVRSNMKKSQKLQEILNQLDKRSNHQSKQQFDFSNFGPVQQNKSTEKSFTSEMFNQPKQQSIPQSKQKPEFQFQLDNSRQIGQISYLYSNNESFRFQRSMSFQLPQNKQCQRFVKLKQLLSKAKKNNLDAFYRNIDQAAIENNEGNKQFQNKNQFKQFTRNMRQQKKQQQARYQTMIAQKKLNTKPKTAFDIKANLFGKQTAQAFRKKNAVDFNILPDQYTHQDKQEQQIDFFNTDEDEKQKSKPQIHEDPEFFKQKKQNFYREAQQFFDIGNNGKQLKISQIKKKGKSELPPIRQQKHTMLDHSLQQKKFQQLISNYGNMKNNYHTLMQQLKQTSQGQFKLMDEMQKIKQDYTVANQNKQQQSRVKVEEKKMQKQQKEKIKQIKQQQLAQIKNQIHQIKATGSQKDLAYLKINEKIEQLEQIVRAALQQVQEQKNQKNNFTPKVINYFDNRYQFQQKAGSPKSQKQQFQDQQPNLSRQSENIYEIPNQQYQQFSTSQNQFHISNQRNKSNQASRQKVASKHQSRIGSNFHSNSESIKRQSQDRSAYVEKNSIKDQLNFIDQFSSPLQLDLSAQLNNLNNVSSDQIEQVYEIPFNPAQNALQYLPLKLDQVQTKNLRNILTQKNSILYESFQFLVTVRYTIQQDDLYPVVGNLRIANKCAIDLLDIFVIVYGPQGQNVEVTPNKVFQQRLNYNQNIFFEVKLDKTCIQDNGFNVQICYKTDSITKKKINFKALLPIIQMIRPQFCYQQNFLDAWDIFRNEIFIRPRKLNFKQIRNHEDLKLVLPFIHISQHDQNTFSYGIMFRYPKSKTVFMLKICCYVNGKASVHLRSDKNGDQKLKEQILNIINFLFLI